MAAAQMPKFHALSVIQDQLRKWHESDPLCVCARARVCARVRVCVGGDVWGCVGVCVWIVQSYDRKMYLDDND